MSYWRFKHEKPEFYEDLGIRWFKKWIPTGDVVQRKLHFPSELRGNTRQERVESLVSFTKGTEKLHLAGIAIMGATEAYTSIETHDILMPAILFNVGQVAVNVYPIMLQRYNRLRAYNVLEKMEAVEIDASPLPIDAEME